MFFQERAHRIVDRIVHIFKARHTTIIRVRNSIGLIEKHQFGGGIFRAHGTERGIHRFVECCNHIKFRPVTVSDLPRPLSADVNAMIRANGLRAVVRRFANMESTGASAINKQCILDDTLADSLACWRPADVAQADKKNRLLEAHWRLFSKSGNFYFFTFTLGTILAAMSLILGYSLSTNGLASFAVLPLTESVSALICCSRASIAAFLLTFKS